MRAAGLVCLGAGAGLIRAGLRAVRGSDVICRSGGVIVAVRGARPRAVPVLARYHDRLLAAARLAGARPVTGGTAQITPTRHGKQNQLPLPAATATTPCHNAGAGKAPAPTREPRTKCQTQTKSLRAMLETCGSAGKGGRRGCTFPVIES